MRFMCVYVMKSRRSIVLYKFKWKFHSIKKIFDVCAVHELASQTPEGLRDVTSEPSPVQEMMLIQTQVSEFISISTLCRCVSSTWLANRAVGVVLSRKGKQDVVNHICYWRSDMEGCQVRVMVETPVFSRASFVTVLVAINFRLMEFS